MKREKNKTPYLATRYNNADEVFGDLLHEIQKHGTNFADTKALFDIGFVILNPEDNIIKHEVRNFNFDYAFAEWTWYLTGDPKISKLGDIYGKVPEIWKHMQDEEGKVRSNYGWQWRRNGQLDKVIEKIKTNPSTRHATVSIYDGKEIDTYAHDTPCTYAIQFHVQGSFLNMSVYMRSNDLWFGFCTDQYCFSMLQQLVAHKTGYDVGWYYHHVHNMHLYNDRIKKLKT